ncbi:glycosyltransferase family 4 protein [Halopseudomonas pelagia]|uniref:glycosyltransferase family 4 protein n=1 Tax=Halopseudomonas pelagia TaxID=553151 RepID=UPI00048F6DBD
MAAPRRFALVTETFAPQINGVANTLGQLVEGLLARHHVLQLVRPAQPGEAIGASALGAFSELRVRGIPIPGYPELQWGLPATNNLRRLWRRERPDAIYLATEGPLGWSALKLARRMGIPVISGFHTNFQQYSDHYGLGLFHRPMMAYLRWFHNHTQLTLTAGPGQQRALLRAGMRNLAQLGRGVDCERFHPAHRDSALREHWRAAENDLVLLHVGRLAAEKNLSLLVQAWQQLQRHHTPGSAQLHLIIVGDGPSRQELQRQLPDATFTGALTGQALSQAYASADIFLFPSVTETFGNVVTEAMASGLAVCAFDLAAAHQHIRDRFSGCLATEGYESLFIDNLDWLISDAEGRRSIRLHARHHACQLGWDAVIQRFEGYLLKAAEGQKTGLPVLQGNSPGKPVR